MMNREKDPLPLEIERKLLIAMPDEKLLAAQEGACCHSIRQTYLTPACKGETRRVRCRMREDGQCLYTETKKLHIAALTCIERERELSREEYEALLTERDPAREDILKHRHTFPYGHHLVEIDIYPFWRQHAILEVELSAPDEAFTLPPYITVIADVSDDRRFKNSALAKHIPAEDELFPHKNRTDFSL